MTTHPPDLRTFYASALDALPDDPEAGEGFVSLDAVTLPAPPPALATAQLCVTAGQHWYGHFLADEVCIEGDKPTLRALGLFLLASVLHPRAEGYRLGVTHPRATLRTIVVESVEDVGGTAPGLVTRALRFNYYPHPVQRHPWLDEAPSPHELPVVALTNASEYVDGPEALASRDVVIGFGPRAGVVRLAELLLNAGRPSNAVTEFRLEAEPGFRGVGPASAEIAIWLPGGFGYLDAPIETPET